MDAILKGAVAVITAQQLNPSIFSIAWVSRQLGVDLDDFTGPTVSNPSMSVVQTTRFQLLVVADRLQFIPQVDQDQQAQLVSEKVGRIAEKLPETPFTAIGLNFNWSLGDSVARNCDVSRRLFFSRENWLCQEFDAPDACFGGYFSRDFQGFRLKLNVLPLAETESEGDPDLVAFAFNFHKPITGDEKERDIKDALRAWDALRAESQRIVEAGVREVGR